MLEFFQYVLVIWRVILNFIALLFPFFYHLKNNTVKIGLPFFSKIKYAEKLARIRFCSAVFSLIFILKQNNIIHQCGLHLNVLSFLHSSPSVSFHVIGVNSGDRKTVVLF